MDDMTRRKMCTGKKRFNSEIDVKIVMALASRKTDVIRYYHCPLCRGWHMTSKKRGGHK